MQLLEKGIPHLDFDLGKDRIRTLKNNDQLRNQDEVMEQQQEVWGGNLEFLMSCLTTSIGLGNIWRFPYTVFENGGGAFIIPYLITLFVIGRPIYYLEMALGQFSSKGTIKMYSSLRPALTGLGFCQILCTAIIASYYSGLTAISLFYFLHSFTSQLPWAVCDPRWEEQNQIENVTCWSSSQQMFGNETAHILSSSELWYTREVLHEKPQIADGIGAPLWSLSICTLASWIIIFFLCFRGIKNAGKAAYVFALFPYVTMLALFVKAVTLEGAGQGMLFFITPQWEKIAEARVWFAAICQCFFSLGVGIGNINVLSSFNNFRYSINRDVWVIAIVDTLTSILAGLTIFGILGNLAVELNQKIDSVIKTGGAGLAFVTYPDAIAKFQSIPWLFAILFFLMLFLLALGSMMSMLTNINKAIKDAFPRCEYYAIALCTSIVGFFIGLVYVTPGGQFILNLMDFYGGTFLVFVAVVIELVVVSWWYGVENLCLDFEFMLEKRVAPYWRITWGLLSPITMMVILLYFLITLNRLKYGSYDYPDMVLGIGWGVVLAGMLIMLGYFVLTPLRYVGHQGASWAYATAKWGPKDEKLREEWRAFKMQKLEEKSIRDNSWWSDKLHFFMGR